MQVTAKHYLIQLQWDHSETPTYAYYPFEMTGSEYATVREEELVLQIPDDFDGRPQRIEALEAKKTRLEADFSQHCMKIDDAISKLRALPAPPAEEI